MHCQLPLPLIALLSLVTLQTAALPSLRSLIPRTWDRLSGDLEKRQAHNFETSSNGSEFLWLIKDTYQGKSFFE